MFGQEKIIIILYPRRKKLPMILHANQPVFCGLLGPEPHGITGQGPKSLAGWPMCEAVKIE